MYERFALMALALISVSLIIHKTDEIHLTGTVKSLTRYVMFSVKS